MTSLSRVVALAKEPFEFCHLLRRVGFENAIAMRFAFAFSISHRKSTPGDGMSMLLKYTFICVSKNASISLRLKSSTLISF